MGYRTTSAAGAVVLALGMALGAGAATPAHAASMKECSLKYKAAKTAGTLNGEDWKAFRAAQCGSGATAAAPAAATTPAASAATAPTAASAAVATPPALPGKSASARRSATPDTAPGGASGTAVFPSGINAKYASLKPGKQRMQTCLDQYHANKTNGGNGGMKWIQKGGGYFSECTKKLKTA